MAVQVKFVDGFGDVLLIDGELITVVNKAGEIYKGILVNGMLECDSRIGLSYIMRALNEYIDVLKANNGNERTYDLIMY